MKFTREQPNEINLIRQYTVDEIRIGERVLRASVLFAPQALRENWPPRTIEELTAAHFVDAFAWQPEIILLGTGPTQRFPSPEIFAAIQSRAIGFEVMDTGAACRTFNVLASEGRRVVCGVLIRPLSQ